MSQANLRHHLPATPKLAKPDLQLTVQCGVWPKPHDRSSDNWQAQEEAQKAGCVNTKSATWCWCDSDEINYSGLTPCNRGLHCSAESSLQANGKSSFTILSRGVWGCYVHGCIWEIPDLGWNRHVKNLVSGLPNGATETWSSREDKMDFWWCYRHMCHLGAQDKKIGHSLREGWREGGVAYSPSPVSSQ